MNLFKIVRNCLYVDIAVAALAFANAAYNDVRFYSVPEISQLCMKNHGPVRIRNYSGRQDLVENVQDKSQQLEAGRYLNNFNNSRAVLGLSGLAAIGAASGLALMNRK